MLRDAGKRREPLTRGWPQLWAEAKPADIVNPPGRSSLGLGAGGAELFRVPLNG